jgi:hypothetical protein
MLQHTDYLQFIEKAARHIVSAKFPAPLSKFTESKLHSLKLRLVTPLQKQFDVRLKAILCEPDPEESFYQLCDLYSQGLPERRVEIQKRWDFNRTWKLPDQTTLACNLSNDRSCEDRIRVSLIYASLMNQSDYRDLLMWLAPIYHSALQCGINADDLLKDISNISSPVAASLIHGFINRTADEKSLAAWGLKAESTAQGVKIKFRQIHRAKQ